jgi:hypothetical protein
MRRGEIDPVSHQRGLGALRKSRDAYNRKAWAVMDAFFRRDFPMTVSCDLQDEVQAVLEGRAEFK